MVYNPLLDSTDGYYYQSNLGLYLPEEINKLKESSSQAIQVNSSGYARPLTLKQYISFQLLQSRRKYFVFHEMYKRDTWIRACIDYIVRRATRDPNRLVDIANPDNPDIEDLQEFLDNCNPDADFDDLYAGVIQDLLEYQQSYIWIQKTRAGNILGLWPLDSRITFPITDQHGTILCHTQVYNGVIEIFDADEVIYFSSRNNGSDPKGIPGMETLVDSVSMELNANKYNNALFENNLNIGAIFSIPEATDEDIEENKRYLSDQYASPENAHRPLILKGNAKLLRDGALLTKDINFEMLISLARQRACAVFGVPESLLGITRSVNRSEGQVHERDTYVNTCRPIRKKANRQFTRQFIHSEKNWNSKTIRLDEPINSMLPTQGEIDAVNKAAEVGLRYNDMLEMLGLPRVPNGDYIVMKIPSQGGYQRLDTVMPGLDDAHFDFVAYQNEHDAMMQHQEFMSANGMQAPASSSSYSPPRPQDTIQQESIAARIIDVSLAETDEWIDGELYRRIPNAPGARGGNLYYTSSGKVRYGAPPKGKASPSTAPSGEQKANDLVNVKDPNSPKRLTDDERLKVAAAKTQVEALFAQAQQENWTNDDFFSKMLDFGWDKAIDTRSEFTEPSEARLEARRLAEHYPNSVYTIIGADGQYFILERDMNSIDNAVGDKPAKGTVDNTIGKSLSFSDKLRGYISKEGVNTIVR